MAGDWIKVECVTPEKPEVFMIAEQLSIDPEHAFGCLVIVWIWADQQTTNGNAHGVTKLLLDRKTGVSGFAEAMIKVGWLEEKEGNLTFKNFEKHNGKSAKTRAQTAKRVASHKKRNSNATGVSDALPREEKRRVKENNKKKKTSLPKSFGISNRVKTWADEKGFSNLEYHLENFIQACEAKNYQYADWDSAFMTAIRNDWAKINNQPKATVRQFPL